MCIRDRYRTDERRDLDVEMAGVFVEVPDGRVIAERDEIACYPLTASRVTTPPGDDPSHQRRRTDVELQPLVTCNVNEIELNSTRRHSGRSSGL